MKLFSVIKKSIKEQVRSFWILVLTVTMAPFFVVIYDLINEGLKPSYKVLIINEDRGFKSEDDYLNYGEKIIEIFKNTNSDTLEFPISLDTARNRSEAVGKLKNRKADLLIIIPANFTQQLSKHEKSIENVLAEIEFVGDLTSVNYMVSGIWVYEKIDDYVNKITQNRKSLKLTETPLGSSGIVTDFDIYVPGLLILSTIMLMFSAPIAFVTEVENKTMLRLKLSKLNTFEFLTGVSFVQILVGILSVVLTLTAAVYLGFNVQGSVELMLFVTVLNIISIIAFSLIIAALTKTVNEILTAGNFPLFLFMFFTGAAFPLKGKALFSTAGYDFTIYGFMSPTRSVNALNKIMIMNMSFRDILPEIFSIIILTIIYFLIGLYLFKIRHMRVK